MKWRRVLNGMSSRLHNFTSNLVKIFEIRQRILGKVDMQKTVYFMKRFGVDVPFEYRWSFLGPYSYDLAHYCNSLEVEGLLFYSGIYSLNKERAKFYADSTISPAVLEKLKIFFTKIDEICARKKYDKVAFLECLASLDFINQNISRGRHRKRTVFLLLQQLKPEKAEIFRNMRDDAWNLLKDVGLITAQEYDQ